MLAEPKSLFTHRFLIKIAIVLFLANVSLGSWIVWNMFFEEDKTQESFVSQIACHGMWLGHTWIEDFHETEEIQELARKLKDHGFGCIYVHASPLTDEGGFDLSRAAYLQNFLTTFKKNAPEITIYAWIGMVTSWHEGQTVGFKFDLSEDDRMLNVQETMFLLVDQYGFDGIHINAEPVEEGSQAFLTFLSGLHSGLEMRDKPLSAAVIFIADQRRINMWTQEGKKFLWGWRPYYYERVSYYVDQLVIMHYEFGLRDPNDFSNKVVEHLKQLQEVRQHADLVLGLPVYDFAYDEAENLEAGLAGIEKARLQGLTVDGLALYSHWEMDSQEWSQWASFIEDKDL